MSNTYFKAMSVMGCEIGGITRRSLCRHNCCDGENCVTWLEKQFAKLNEYEEAKADGRLLIIPDGYEYAKEFYHVVNAPLWCVEDGWGCEDCPYEEEVGNITDCKFKPYVSRLKPNTVLKAMYVLRNLFLSKEAADQALSTCNTTGESEHRRGGNE